MSIKIIQLRTKDDLNTLQRHNMSGDWRLNNPKELSKSKKVWIDNWDGTKRIVADYHSYQIHPIKKKTIIFFTNPIIKNINKKWEHGTCSALYKTLHLI